MGGDGIFIIADDVEMTVNNNLAEFEVLFFITCLDRYVFTINGVLPFDSQSWQGVATQTWSAVRMTNAYARFSATVDEIGSWELSGSEFRHQINGSYDMTNIVYNDGSNVLYMGHFGSSIYLRNAQSGTCEQVTFFKDGANSTWPGLYFQSSNSYIATAKTVLSFGGGGSLGRCPVYLQASDVFSGKVEIENLVNLYIQSSNVFVDTATLDFITGATTSEIARVDFQNPGMAEAVGYLAKIFTVLAEGGHAQF